MKMAWRNLFITLDANLKIIFNITFKKWKAQFHLFLPEPTNALSFWNSLIRSRFGVAPDLTLQSCEVHLSEGNRYMCAG